MKVLQDPLARKSPRLSPWSFRSGLLLLAAVLRIAIAGNGYAGAEASYHDDGNGTHGDQVFAQAGLFLYHLPPSEDLVQPFNAPPPSSVKDRRTGTTAIMCVKQRVMSAAFVQAVLVDRKVLSTFRRCGLLFPFHFFW